MYRFLVLPLILAFVSWGIFLRLFFYLPPENSTTVLIFLLTLLSALGLTFSFLFYYFLDHRSPYWIERRDLFRRALVWGLLLGFLVCAFLFYRYVRLP